MRKHLLCAAIILGLVMPGVASAKAPETWDGLVRVKGKRVQFAYLRPQADFSGYTKVVLDPAQVAFRKNWRRDVNSASGLSQNVSESEARAMLDEAQAGLDRLFADSFRSAGYEIVSAAGPDVLRLSVGVADLSISAPDRAMSSRSRTYARDAGYATLILEARDSVSGELIGRAVDRQTVGNFSMPTRRTEMSNRADFEQQFQSWAKGSAKGLSELKAASPVNTDGIRKN